jgi:hypothetical protein
MLQRGRTPRRHRPKLWVILKLAGTDLWWEQGFEVEDVFWWRAFASAARWYPTARKQRLREECGSPGGKSLEGKTSKALPA